MVTEFRLPLRLLPVSSMARPTVGFHTNAVTCYDADRFGFGGLKVTLTLFVRRPVTFGRALGLSQTQWHRHDILHAADRPTNAGNSL